MRMPKDESEKAKVHKDLKGLDLKVNNLGEIQSSIPIDKIIDFLDEHVEDKKIDNKTKKASSD